MRDLVANTWLSSPSTFSRATGSSPRTAVGQAGVEVLVQDQVVDLVQGRLDGLHLLDDVDAVGILLQHALDAADVTLDGLQAFECFGVMHGFAPSAPFREE